jgi:hypothetical protein
MPDPTQFRAASTRTFSTLMVVIGIALVVRTITEGGGGLAVGLLLGILFIAAGAGRLYMQFRG